MDEWRSPTLSSPYHPGYREFTSTSIGPAFQERSEKILDKYKIVAGWSPTSYRSFWSRKPRLLLFLILLVLELGLFRAFFHSFGECAWELGEYHEGTVSQRLRLILFSFSCQTRLRSWSRMLESVTDLIIVLIRKLLLPTPSAFPDNLPSKAHHVDSAS